MASSRRTAQREALPGMGLSIGAGMGATVGVLVTGTAIGLALGGGVGAGIGLIVGAIARNVIAARSSARVVPSTANTRTGTPRDPSG